MWLFPAGQAQEAINAAEPAKSYDLQFIQHPIVQGLAYLQLHDASSCVERIPIRGPGQLRDPAASVCSFLRSGAILGLARAYAMGGDKPNAKKAYEAGIRHLERRGHGLADAGSGEEGIRRALNQKGEVLRRSIFIPLIVLTLLLAGCQSTYYKTMRTLGKEKRDILVQRIKDAKKDQDQTKKQLQTTMESFQALTGFQGGSLEKSYKRLNSDYESAASQAGKLHDKIQSIDQVSNDLFKEWQGEINAMDNGKLKSQDTVMLRNAKTARRPTCAPCVVRKTRSRRS